MSFIDIIMALIPYIFINQGGSEVGQNKGWIQQTKCDHIQCPEMCSSGWQYSDGMAWRLDASMKPTCGKYVLQKGNEYFPLIFI